MGKLWRFSSIFVAIIAFWGSATRSQDYVDECPEPNGFYADAVQCDRYYECKNGEIFDRYCPDGLVFDETSIQFAKCSFPFSVDCSDRPELQKANPTALCPRQNGYFEHEDPEVCDKFYFCVDGVPNPITCPASLIFSPKRGQCAYSDQVARKGCSSAEVFKFHCPQTRESNKHEHPRYADPNDCQYFYICIGGTDARRNGCQDGMVFNKETLACDRQINVNDPQCRNWYNETFLEGLRVPSASTGAVPGGGTLLETKNRKRVGVRRRPRPQIQEQVSVSTSETFSTSIGQRNPPATPVRRPVSSNNPRPTVPPSINQGTRQRVRTRVRRPNPVQQEALPVEEGPPSFSLTSQEDIQNFRESNPFAPQTDQGRLTVLSGTGTPVRSFAAVPAVPPSFQDVQDTQEPARQRPRQRPRPAVEPQPVEEEPTFGNRFQSRRPPGADPRRRPAAAAAPSGSQLDSEFAGGRRPGGFGDPSVSSFAQNVEPAVPVTGSRVRQRPSVSRNPASGGFSRRPPAVADTFDDEQDVQRFESSRRPPGGFTRSRTPPSATSSFASDAGFDGTSGTRLQVQEIRVRPQASAEEENLDFDDFRRVASQFRQRQRGSQQ